MTWTSDARKTFFWFFKEPLFLYHLFIIYTTFFHYKEPLMPLKGFVDKVLYGYSPTNLLFGTFHFNTESSNQTCCFHAISFLYWLLTLILMVSSLLDLVLLVYCALLSMLCTPWHLRKASTCFWHCDDPK